MPLFIDVHTEDHEDGAEDLAPAPAREPGAQGGRASEDEPFWLGDKAGKVFWLVEAPSAEDARAVHRRAHGAVTSKIYEVQPDTPWFSG